MPEGVSAVFVGRDAELATLEKAYAADGFRMVVVYGRRRVGKTTLLARFAEGKPALFFTAQQQTDANNLADFSRQIALFFQLPASLAFESWEAAFDFLADRAQTAPFLFVFDEFPYAAEANGPLASKLQIAIDHRFQKTRLCMVLCGSDQGFMESEVLGKKSPLHGRRSAQIRVRPFDYLTAARMLPQVSDEDAFLYYACVGGVPYYLSQIDQSLSFRENIAELFFSPEGFLYEEPLMLLRQELREPAVYNSILRAIGAGANRRNEIASRCGMEATAVSKYLATLERLEIIERTVPFGENPETSRKGIFRFADACYDFWYTFVMPVAGEVEKGAGRIVANQLSEEVLSSYLGHRFERVCLQWMLAESLAGRLPIAASSFGQWWGTDPGTRTQEEIDVVAADRLGKRALVGECKWRSQFDESEALEKLARRAGLLGRYKVEELYLFSKNPLSNATLSKMKLAGNQRSVCLSDLYEGR